MPPYDELVLVANEDALERDGGRIRAFLGALARGNRDLRRDPETGHQAAAEGRHRASTPASSGPSLKVTLPLFSPPRGKPYGYQDPAQWNAVRGLDDARTSWSATSRTPAAPTPTSYSPEPGSRSSDRELMQ